MFQEEFTSKHLSVYNLFERKELTSNHLSVHIYLIFVTISLPTHLVQKVLLQFPPLIDVAEEESSQGSRDAAGVVRLMGIFMIPVTMVIHIMVLILVQV